MQYMLVRPYPSLRITFTSPALRIPGLLQTKLLERVGGPAHVREGLADALQRGISVTARISWLTAPSLPSGGGPDDEMSRKTSLRGKTRWIHCTPLFGSDERVGVWMVVMVEQEEVTGLLNRQQQQQQQQHAFSSGSGGGNSGMASPVGAASPRFTGNKLYAEYLRREGRPATAGASLGVVGGGSLRSRRGC